MHGRTKIILRESLRKDHKIGVTVSKPILAILRIIFGILVITKPELLGIIVGIFLVTEGVLLLTEYLELRRQHQPPPQPS